MSQIDQRRQPQGGWQSGQNKPQQHQASISRKMRMTPPLETRV
ncbi:MAG TPA: hypothetical protein VFF88_09275 [Methylocella sp.]|nr:hypothetical protein [Methylocella sp.]